MDDALIREVDPGEAEAVLTVRLSVPGVTDGGEDRYYLARSQPRRSEYVVESVTVNPDGSTTERGTICVTKETLVAHCYHADGATPDGRGCGYGKTVSIEGRSAEEVVVHLSMYWTAGDGTRGDLDVELAVPWLGASRKELDGGGWVAAEITAIGGTAAPGE